MRALCGLLLFVGCSADPVASEGASWSARGPNEPHVAMSPVATLVQLDRPAYAITLDANNVYFTTNVGASNEAKPAVVWQCAKSGCDAATPIAYGHAMPNETTPKSILSCPIGGCGGGTDPRIVTFQDPILDLASDGTSIFWLGSGDVRACDGSSCDATTRTIIADTDAVQISIDGPVLWLRNFVDESIVRCSMSDCGSTEARIATDFGFTPFAIDPTNVYFRTPAGISRCAKTGCRKPSVIAPLDKDASVTDIAADGARVYWIDHQAIHACPITGCNKPAIIAPGGDGLAAANHLALDEHYVYWTAGNALGGSMTTDKVEHHGPGAIFRVAK